MRGGRRCEGRAPLGLRSPPMRGWAPAWEADRPGRRRSERSKDFLVSRLFNDLQVGKFSRRSVATGAGDAADAESA
jgi:hypothetical protein